MTPEEYAKARAEFRARVSQGAGAAARVVRGDAFVSDVFLPAAEARPAALQPVVVRTMGRR